MGQPTSLLDPVPLPLREGDFFEVIRETSLKVFKNYRVPVAAGSVVQATTVVKGVARLATELESGLADDVLLAITPAGLEAAVRYWLQNNVVQGDNVTLTYDDEAGTLTVAVNELVE